MNNQMIRTTRLTDGQIIDLLVAIRDADDIGFESASLKFGLGVEQKITSNPDDAQLDQYKGNELLRSFSSASVGPNGAEVTLDRKSGKRLAKTISASDG